MNDHLFRYAPVIVAAYTLVMGGCKPLSSKDEISDTSTKATSIWHIDSGNVDRCGNDDGPIGNSGNIYDDVYLKSETFFRTIIDRLEKDSDGRLKTDGQKNFVIRKELGIQPSYHTKKTLLESARMLLNIMGDDGTTSPPARPLLPAAFFAVIRDFEASKGNQWSNHEFFGITTNNCDHGPCYGMFKIDLVDFSLARLKELCGRRGLGILDHSDPYQSNQVMGALDFCAALQWWNGQENKCSNLRINMDHVTDNQKPTKWGEKICIPLPEVPSTIENPCNKPHTPWTPKTFAWGYFCAYIQENQWEHYGIYDTWGRAYTGFNASEVPALSSSKEVKGYEYCAIKRYLKSLKETGKCIQGGDNFDVTQRPPPPALVRATVADFACKIGLFPAWLSQSDCDNFDPRKVTGHTPKTPETSTQTDETTRSWQSRLNARRGRRGKPNTPSDLAQEHPPTSTDPTQTTEDSEQIWDAAQCPGGIVKDLPLQ